MNEKYGIELELIMSKFKTKIDEIKKTFSGIRDQKLKIDVEGAQLDAIKIKIQELENMLNDNARKPFLRSEEILDTRVKLEKLYNQLEKIENEEEEIAVKGNIAFNSLQKGIDKATSKIKRFALSLFSIRSIYALVSKASSAYLSQDAELANKLQAVWVGLGSMLEPIISAIANTLLKAVKYVNVFIQALTGVDLLSKATAKSMQKATNSAKALNKALAGFDEITNLDTTSANIDMSWVDAFNNVNLNTEWVEKIRGFGEWLKTNKETVCGAILGIAGAFALIKLIPLIASFSDLIVVIGFIVMAFVGLNEIINGDTGAAIEGLMFLFGGSGLAGYLLGGVNGVSVAIAISSVIALFQGLTDLLSGDVTKSAKGFIELVVGATGLVIALNLIRGGASAGLLGILTPLTLVVAGFTAFAAGIVAVIKNWNNMSTLQKVVSILGLIAVGAAAAAAAVGALQSAWSLGIAAAAIVAGTAAIAASVSAANKKAKENIPQLAVGTNYVPEDQLAYIHKGEAVVPKKFNSQEYFGTGNNETNSLLEQVIDAINNIEINPYTTVKDVGRATVNYVREKERQTGRSVFA